MAPRRKFDLEMLDECLKRDGATTSFDRNLPIKSQTLIEFVCECGAENSKRLDNAVDYGMFCPTCMAEKSVERRKASVLKSKQNVLEQSKQYVLEMADGTQQVMKHDEKLSLVVAAEYVNPKISRSSYETRDYIVAKYWNMVEECIRSRKFRVVNNSVQEQQAAARLFLDTVPVVPAGYTITRTMEELAAKPSWSERYCRIAPSILDYEEKEVPIDTYWLASWLGDGTAGTTQLTNIEPEIIKYWQDYATNNDFALTSMKDGITYNVTDPGRKNNRLRDALRHEGIFTEKAVPRIYIENSQTVRMTFLAGLLDTDGSKRSEYTKKNSTETQTGVSYEFSQCVAHEAIFDGFREIVHSLGWRMSKNACLKQCTDKNGVKKKFPAFRGTIIGDDRLQNIPVLVPRKKITRSSEARYDLFKFKIKNVK